jgi:cell division protein FtsW
MLKTFLLDNIDNYWRNIDKSILFSFLILFFLGVFFSFSSTSSLAGERLDKANYFFFIRHFIFAFLSLSLMLAISSVRLDMLNKAIAPLFLFLLILLILVPFIGVEVKGSRRWLNIFFLRLQPVELIKPFFILMTARILCSQLFDKNFISYFLSFFILTSVVLLLINQPDFGQSVLIVSTWLSLIFISGIKLMYLVLIGIFVLSLSILIFFLFPEKFGYIIYRLLTFLDPSSGDNFQNEKALEAIKLGGLKGQGMGEGILKDNVPEAHTDYIIAIISEEFGSILSIMIVLIFLYISYRVIKICIKEENEFIRLSLSGLSSLLIFQTFIHIGVNTSLLPTTGMTLPFLSYGGSSLIGSAILAGMILNFTKKRFQNEK